MTLTLNKYIPVGSLVFSHEEIVSEEIWSCSELAEWLTFDADTSRSQDSSSCLLPSHIQHLLFHETPLSPYGELLSRQWMQMTFRIVDDDKPRLFVRVYLLPDDIERRLIPRDSSRLIKARLQLLSSLDTSPTTWLGQTVKNSPIPSVSESTSEPENTSNSTLLQLFNDIPSPSPELELVTDPEVRQCMADLLASTVPGLVTELYTYQRRSAAVMLQKEAQPKRVLDPRLTPEVDMNGETWYRDTIVGSGLRDARYYESACGGILAEQMGSGKTLISLSLILATKHLPSVIPELYRPPMPVRPRVGSLIDMAAACVTRNDVPWKLALCSGGYEYTRCLEAIRRNPGCYNVPVPQRSRPGRQVFSSNLPPITIFSSHASLIVVPLNLVQQWKNEVAKHTSGLRVLVLDQTKQTPPNVPELVEYDIVLISWNWLERLVKTCGKDSNGKLQLESPLARIHFKRCIIDEGHRLGNSTLRTKSNLLIVLDSLHISARWVVTGTPSKGLYGVDDVASDAHSRQTAASLEKDDLKRIGSIATLYLKARPWANTAGEVGDQPADWAVYIMQPQHSSRSAGNEKCLRTTLADLIVRHRLSEIGDILPTVDEKIVYLDGSYQDVLCLNLFSMIITFNAVQSQRTDLDYFFHPRQRKNLKQLVSNLRQATFFGGSFFSPDDIRKALDTATKFLEEGKVPISAEDEKQLREAIAFGQLASTNTLKTLANTFHEVPLYVENFPGGRGQAWSLDDSDADPICTDARLMLALQKAIQPSLDAPTSLDLLLTSGRLDAAGREARNQALADVTEAAPGRQATMAGNTQAGQDSVPAGAGKRKFSANLAEEAAEAPHVGKLAAPLAHTRLVATASAKLSYLVDQILLHQAKEQMIVFYESENVAYYLAGVLEILQVEHLIYAKSITVERRAQYVATFNYNPKFRVLLMDISQAAFGLDMRSASRIYFLHPVLDPQVAAQAIGRARRISTHSARTTVTVVILVLRGSLEEAIVRRRAEMSHAEQRRCKSLLDDRPLYEWVLNPRMLPLPGPEARVRRRSNGGGVNINGDGEVSVNGRKGEREGLAQSARLRAPPLLFGRDLRQVVSEDPDRDLVDGAHAAHPVVTSLVNGRAKRLDTGSVPNGDGPATKKRAVRFAD